MNSNLLPKIFLVFFLLTASTELFAQHVVKGTVVTSNDNVPIIGASIQVEGSVAGTQTDANGQFSLDVLSGKTLVISSLGFAKKEVSIGNATVLKILLTPNDKALNEVVVTGYTSQRKKDIIGAVSVVSAKDARETPAGNFAQSLQGKVPGVAISNDANPGGDAVIRIRGLGTFNDNNPLIIVDGVQLNGSLSDVNPNDVQSIQVLKDATSASIYGSRASSGVIIVTTKHGGPGPTRINVDVTTGIQELYREPHLLNPLQYAQTQFLSAQNDTTPGALITSKLYGTGIQPVLPDYLLAGPYAGVQAGNPAYNDPSLYNYTTDQTTFYQITKANKAGTDWFKQVFKPALIQSYNLSAIGGSESARFAFSANYFNQKGTVVNTYYKRYEIRANSDYTLKKWFRVGENAEVSYSDQNGTGPGDIYGNTVSEAYRILQIIPVYDIRGNFAGSQGAELGDEANPVALQKRAASNYNRNVRILGDVFAEATLFNHFKAKTTFGLDYSTSNSINLTVPNPEQKEGNFDITQLSAFNNQDLGWNFTNTFIYDQNFKDHHITLLAGNEAVYDLRHPVGCK